MWSVPSHRRIRIDSHRFHMSGCVSACECCYWDCKREAQPPGSIKSAGYGCWGTLAAFFTMWLQPLEDNFHNFIIQQRALNSRWAEKSSSLALLQLGICLTLTMRVHSDPLLSLSQTCKSCLKKLTSLHLSCAYIYYLSCHNSVNKIQLTQHIKGYMELYTIR